MVPEDTVIKGGNSLALTYPLAQTRFSKDLDLVATEGFESWKKTFVRNLEKGFNGFTGNWSVGEAPNSIHTFWDRCGWKAWT
jgi:predicted nucleotidyltransferase component of viral defense system